MLSWSGWGALCDDNGGVRIESITDCKDAIPFVSINSSYWINDTVTHINNENRPSGCSIYHETWGYNCIGNCETYLHFNEHQNGSKHANSQQLCARGKFCNSSMRINYRI